MDAAPSLLSMPLPTPLAVAAWLVLMALASGAGLALVGAWPWVARARESGVALAAGLAAAPLLAGLAMVGVLWAWPQAPARSQAAVVFALLAAAALPGWLTGASRRVWVPGTALVPRGPAAVLVLAFFAALGLDIAAVPLIQNDALEYATVGRILFDTRDAAAYPVLDPTRHASGFHGLWTHPPLYVALIALGFAVQGHSEETLLMRLVAPWCLAGAAACVAALSRWANPARPADGPLAALLLVSTPLLFLGAASALIDALPVLGLTLAFTALAALAGAWWQRALGLGTMLALALWTHSQAVLVPLLVLPLLWVLPMPGRADGRGARWIRRFSARAPTAVAIAVVALAAALVLGGAHYLRNVRLFGSPISDNPVVFALPSLDWPGYFAIQRGLASAAELVQYGLLKPWFALEAYGIVFWWMAAAAVGLARSRQPLPLVADGGDRLRTLALGVVGLYLAGAVLSVLLGIDLMVRNERYMLVLLPVAAIVAAAGLNRPLVRGVIVGLIGLQLVVLVIYRLGQLHAQMTAPAPAVAAAAPADDARLHRWGPYGAVRFLREATPPEARVLSLKPADMFYAGRTMVSYLDPRLVPFYAEREPAAAAARLRDLGITHVHVPDYWLPPVYHSALAALLADPGSTTLVFDANGYQIYALQPAPQAQRSRSCGAPLAFGDWQRGREFVLGGRKNLLRLRLGTTAWPGGAESRAWNPTPVFLRETNTVLRAEVALPAASRFGAAASSEAAAGSAAGAPAPREWLLQLELAGSGYVQVLAHPRGAGQAERLLADRPLGPPAPAGGAGMREGGVEGGVTSIERRFSIDAAAQRLDLRLEHRADSRLRVLRAALVPLACGAP